MTLGPVRTQGESSDDERAKIFPKRFDMPLRVIAQEQLAKLLEQGTFVIEDIPEASHTYIVFHVPLVHKDCAN